MNKMTIHAISSDKFIHPADKLAMEKVIGFSALKNFLDTSFENGLNDVCEYAYKASCMPIPDSSELYGVMDKACEIFGVGKHPSLFIKRDYNYDITTVGYDDPVIIIPSSLYNCNDREIIEGRLCAAAASVAAGHHRIAFVLWILENMRGIIPIPFAEDVLLSLLYEWKRCRDYTLDRAFALACDSLSLAKRNILFGELPPETAKNFYYSPEDDTFALQVKNFENDANITGKISAVYAFLQNDSYLPLRYAELEKFASERRIGK